MHILLFFVDGFGLGLDDPNRNPLFTTASRTLRALFGTIPTWRKTASMAGDLVPARLDAVEHWAGADAILIPTDATLGVPGVPQSGTGQTAIFTGVNAAAEIGGHLGPYPNAALRAIIARGSLFSRLEAQGLRVEFGNAYPPVFFERLARHKARRTAIMQAALKSGVRLRGVDDLALGEAVSAWSVTNSVWRERGAPVPLITAREAGQNLMRLAQRNDFTAFEYSLTDAAGHKNDHGWILEVLAELDELWGGLLDEMDHEGTCLIITSDHGNIEDWSVRGHNLNPVPTILVGAGRKELAPQIHSLVNIAPAIERMLINTSRITARVDV